MRARAGYAISQRAIGLLLTLGVAVGGCSGSEATPAAYFDSLTDETERYAEAIDALRQTYADELADELAALQERTDLTDTSAVASYFDQAKEVAIVKTADLFSKSATELRSLIDALSAMEPPEGLAEPHADAVGSGEALAAAMPVTIETVRNLGAVEDLDRALQDSPYTVAIRRFDLACQNLEVAAAAAGIEVELACPTGEPDEGAG